MTTSNMPFDYGSLLPQVLLRADLAADAKRENATRRLLDAMETLFSHFEQVLDTVPDRFDPVRTPDDFLPWLASWAALVLRADWSQEQKRQVLARIVPLYRMRGTREGLEQYLRAYVGTGVQVEDLHQPLQVGVTATVGTDTVVGGIPANLFRVRVAFTTSDLAGLSKRTESVRAVLDIEKPAHTDYILSVSGPTFRVGVQALVGVDTYI